MSSYEYFASGPFVKVPAAYAEYCRVYADGKVQTGAQIAEAIREMIV